MAKTLAESARSRNDLKTDNETLREELGTAKDEVQQLREQVEELEQGSADGNSTSGEEETEEERTKHKATISQTTKKIKELNEKIIRRRMRSNQFKDCERLLRKNKASYVKELTT